MQINKVLVYGNRSLGLTYFLFLCDAKRLLHFSYINWTGVCYDRASWEKCHFNAPPRHLHRLKRNSGRQRRKSNARRIRCRVDFIPWYHLFHSIFTVGTRQSSRYLRINMQYTIKHAENVWNKLIYNRKKWIWTLPTINTI